jgi:aldose sugar dehydrogenase
MQRTNRTRAGLACCTLLVLVSAGCLNNASARLLTGSDGSRITVTPLAAFDQPWAMTFLPDGRLLITEKAGRLLLVDQQGGLLGTVAGVPAVDYGGQGGLGDIVLHPAYTVNGMVYLSYAEAGEGGIRGAAVARARLEFDGGTSRLADLAVIWRQAPKVTGRGHYGHRLAFAPDGHLFITSGERQKFAPAQDMSGNLGKIVRLNDDGSVPGDNPFADRGGVTAQIWTLGHRNPLGMAFDAQGRLWSHEMGPAHGDELNLIRRGEDYGYPSVSNGNHYDGREIPHHDTRPEFTAPAAYWVPAISPAGFAIYDGSEFPDWRGNGFIGGLSSQALIRVVLSGEGAREVERFDMGNRIREVAQGPDGALWLLEDGARGRLLRLTSPTE